MDAHGERHQLMILRAWVEADGDQSLRVRITTVTDDRPDRPQTTARGTVDDVCALVRAWLETMLAEVGRAGWPGEDWPGEEELRVDE